MSLQLPVLKLIIPYWLLIFPLIPPTTSAPVYEGGAVHTIKPASIKPLQTHLQPVSELSTIYVAPTPVVTPIAPVTASQCASGITVPDYYENLVMQRESSGNSCAMNPSGACGLFQALPCSKMGCSLYDVACQEAWGESYISSTYGTASNAWQHELDFGWY